MILGAPQAHPVVVLSGELDLYEAPRVRDALDALNGPGTVDMRDVRYLDASALNELARVANRAAPHPVTLIVESPHVRRVLDIMQFDRLFHIVGCAE